MKVENVVIDAAGCSLGRLAAYSAKAALDGKKVVIFNAEAAVISGKGDRIFEDYKRMYDAKSQANPKRFGPKRPRNPDRFVRRTIRGMLPWKTARGKAAFKRVMVYSGKPEKEIKRKDHIDISKAQLADVAYMKRYYDLSVTVAELCESLGGSNGS